MHAAPDPEFTVLHSRYLSDVRYHAVVHLLRATREAATRGPVSDLDILRLAERIEAVYATGDTVDGTPVTADAWLRKHWEDTARHLAESAPSPNGTMPPSEFIRTSAIQALADAMHQALERPSRSNFVSTGHVDWSIIDRLADEASPVPRGKP
jgi:hypothetical protein